jgi:hypothetical protein
VWKWWVEAGPAGGLILRLAFLDFVGLAGILASKRDSWEAIGFWEFQINVGRTKQSLSTETDP